MKPKTCTHPGCRDRAAFAPKILIRPLGFERRAAAPPTSIHFDLPLCRVHFSMLRIESLLTEEAMREIVERFRGPSRMGPPPDWRTAYIARSAPV